MTRLALPALFAALAAGAGVAACTGPREPAPHADGRIVTHAVELAQARVDAARNREPGQ
jgi:hypothetical protein